MAHRGSGIEPFHFVGIEPFQFVGIEPFRMVGIEPFRQGGRIEPFQTGTRKAASGGGGGDPCSETVLTDALNSATAAIVRWDDNKGDVDARTQGDALWERDDWVRAELAHQALMSRLRYAHGQLWWVPETDAKGKTPDAHPVFTLVAPDEKTTLVAQVDAVLKRKDERPDRASEILVQATNFWPFWTALTGIDPTRHVRTYELMQVAASLSPAVGQRFKHDLDVKRPHQMSALVQPMIAVPGHASYPSGHATGAYLFIHVMKHLLKLKPGSPLLAQLDRMAERIADNRVVSGVHYPIDGLAGKALGELLAEYFVASCEEKHVVQPLVGDAFGKFTSPPPKLAVPAIEPLKTMWEAARTELRVA